MNTFLEERKHLHERVKMGIDVHPSDWEVAEFQKQAKEIDPSIDWVVTGCQECVNKLVKFVFEKQGTIIRKETFPKADRNAKNN